MKNFKKAFGVTFGIYSALAVGYIINRCLLNISPSGKKKETEFNTEPTE